MAIRPRELAQGPFSFDKHKNYEASHVIMGIFASDPAITQTNTAVEAAVLPDRGDTWPLLTPIYFDDTVGATGAWKVWTAGRAIEGFMVPGVNAHDTCSYLNRTGRMQLDAVDETHGLVMLRGQVWYDDLPIPPGESTAFFQDALRGAGLREDGINVYGLVGIH